MIVEKRTDLDERSTPSGDFHKMRMGWRHCMSSRMYGR